MKNDRGDLVLNLFAPKRQYRIPLYQRHYVWDRNNWDTLWTDIEAKFDCRRNNREPFRRHFTGTILTYQDRSEDNLLPPYQILDGQQRLITFQIILCAIRDICLSKRYTIGSGSRLPPPDSLIRYQGSDKRYNKLCPKEGFDEKAFLALAAPENTQEEPSRNHLIHRAYRYFKDKIHKCVEEKFAEIDILYEAVVLDFDMVQINLKDRAGLEKIFASLNATGRMLDEFDRLRMDLFLRAGKNEDRLYRDHWRHFDTEYYWEKQGKSEMFLRQFLRAKVDPACFQTQNGKEVKVFDVYLKQYRPTLKPHQGIEYEFCQLKKYSRVYQKMDDPDSDIGRRMDFYKEFEIEDLFPFILFIISEFSEFAILDDDPESEFAISNVDLELVFDMLESYMVRRMLRWGRDHNYKSIDMVNSFFRICLREQSFSLARFIRHLTDSRPERHQDKWSTDTEVNGALTEEWHDHITKGIRYILYRIEIEMREERPKIDFTDELRLEYIMPRRWEYSLNWQLPLEEGSDRCVPYDNIFSEEHKKNNRSWRKADPSEEGLVDQSYLYALNLAKARRKHQKSIGNLTLVDADIDTDEFAEKKPYFEDFNLAINQAIYDSESWDAPQIEKRAEALIECFHKLWPSSQHFKENYLSKKYPVNSTVQGTVVDNRNDGVLLQLEAGIDGWIPMSEMGWKVVEPLDSKIEAVVLGVSERKGSMEITLSRRPFQPNLYEHLQQKYPIGTKIIGRVLGIKSSGVYVEIEGSIKGKIQNSNLSWKNRKVTADEFLNEDDKIEAVVLQVNADVHHISLGLKQLQPNPWKTLAEKYPVGTQVKGLIRNITKYGAFLEIGEGIEGLLHNTELSWTRPDVTAHELFNEGDQVKVVVLKIDPSKKRVSLGLKQLEPSPEDEIPTSQKYPIGTKVTGRVLKITSYGAFLELEDGIQGLLHNSELSWTNTKAAACKFLNEGDEIKVIVLQVDTEAQHISLGLKQLQPNPWDEISKKYKVGSHVRGRIVNITSSGAFIEIEAGIKGLIHISELTDQKIEKPEEIVSVDEELDLKVISISPEEQKMLLSLKAMDAENLTAITYNGQKNLPQSDRT